MYSRVVNYPDLFERYSGIPRDISRYGFTSGETDQSGICFENGWLIFNLEGVEKVGGWQRYTVRIERKLKFV